MEKNVKVILAVVAVLTLVGGLVVGLILMRQQQDVRSSAAPATTLRISPTTQTKLPGQTVAFTVIMSTGENQVTGVDLNLRYDPDVIEIESILKGSGISSFDQITKNNFDENAGTISYSAFTTNAIAAVQGTSLEVLRISGRVKETADAGTYQTIFSGTTTVSGVESGENVLVSTTPGNLSVLAVGAESSPTATASATPTASASATPTSTPTSTPEVLLDGGVGTPTILGMGLGAFVIVGSLFLLF